MEMIFQAASAIIIQFQAISISDLSDLGFQNFMVTKNYHITTENTQHCTDLSHVHLQPMAAAPVPASSELL